MIRAAEREEQRGQFSPEPQGRGGPNQLISTFLFIASLNVSKEHPNRSNLQDFKNASRFSSPDFHSDPAKP